jgi:hypothetical protein
MRRRCKACGGELAAGQQFSAWSQASNGLCQPCAQAMAEEDAVTESTETVDLAAPSVPRGKTGDSR